MKSLKPMWAVIPYIKPVRRWFWFSVLLAIPMAAIRVGPVPLVKILVDRLLVQKDHKSLILLPLATIGLFTANLVIRFLHYYSNRVVVVHTNELIRKKIMEHIMGLSMDYFTTERGGVLTSRVASDPAHLDGGLGSLNALIREPVTLLGLLGYAIYSNWRLAMVTFVMVPPLAWLFSWSGRLIKNNIRKYQEQFGILMGATQESIQGIRIIHAFNLKDHILRFFDRQSDKVSQILLKISRVEEFSHPGVEWISSIAIAIILYSGGSSVLEGKMTSGGLIAFFAAFAMMVNPLRSLSDINTKLYTAAAAMERIQDLLSWKSKVVVTPGAQKITAIREAVVLENVDFQYPGEQQQVIRSLSFAIPHGKSIALVGPSGSGKSTITHLLTRMADPTSGRILVDGVDLRGLDLESWRNRLALVSQDVFLFYESVMENIRMGRENATEAEIVQAARHANALGFIEKMPQGFNTIVGDRGMRLSGGERQRISIARAFLRNPDFLILDEATSNLDTESERLVQGALDHLMESKTVLVIAHRLSTIRNADEIIVLKDGMMIQRGHYEELEKTPGLFQALLQSGIQSVTGTT